MTYAADPRRVYNRLPSDKEILSIPLAKHDQYSLSDKEMNRLRYHIYKINKDGFRRFRTMREMTSQGLVLLVWRIK